MNIDKPNPPIKTGDRPYKKFTAIATQSGTAAPIFLTPSNILENSLSLTGVPPVLGRTGAGIYTFTLTGAFDGTFFVKSLDVQTGAIAVYASADKTSANVVTITTKSAAGAAVDLVGNIFIALEIWYV